jgi:hypothetical protein
MPAAASRARIAIAPFSAQYVSAVERFNARIAAALGPTELQVPLHPPPEDEERFLAVENDEVRGGYILRSQDFSIAGETRRVAHYRLPISEAIADRAYAGVGLQLLRSALRTQPLLFALGMGGVDQPLPKMLRATGWPMFAVPFYFKVNRPCRFLRGARALRSSAVRRAALDAAAFSGAGALGIRALQWYARRTCNAAALYPSELFRGFAGWADDLWRQCARRYTLAGVRDRSALNRLYPAGDKRFLCLRVFDGGRILGWAVLLDTAMRGHKQFGDLRVGSIADCLALPEDAAAVIAAATRRLEERGVDLIVSNQAHQAWTAALHSAGFLRGPSNFVFAASPELARLLHPFDDNAAGFHVNRGDGDGPIHL